MVEETANQPTNPADEEYEYEYIELAEGEELPEGAEYEYEYVEVPADEAAAVVSGNGADLSSGEKMTATAEADVPAVEISSDTGAEEDIPQFFREDAAQENAPVEPHVVYEPVSAADESGEIIEEPRFEIGLPGEDAGEKISEPHFETDAAAVPAAEKETTAAVSFDDDFLKAETGEFSLDDILDDDSPLPDVTDLADDDFEKMLFGTPEPDLHLNDEKTVPEVSTEAEFEIAEAQQPEELSLTTETPAAEPFATEDTGQADREAEAGVLVTDGDKPIAETFAGPGGENGGADEQMPEPEPEPEPESNIPAEEEKTEIEAAEMPEAEVFDAVEAEEGGSLIFEEIQTENQIEQPVVTEQPAGGEMKSLLPEAAVDEIKEDEPSETVVAAFEDVTGVKTEPESKIDAGGDIFVEASVSEDEGVQQIDAATVPVKDYQVPEPKIPEAAPNEEVSVVEETEENVPVFVPRPSVPAEEISADGREFQQTDEQPVEIVCRELTDDERDALIPTFYEFNKGAGFGQFQADEKIYNLTLSDVDFDTYELENWSLIIFDDYRLRLNPEDKELVLPKADNVVRYAKLLKGGKTKLELFNETQYNFMAPTEEFVKIRGHFIYGNIANNSKLIIKDFINLTLSDKQGQLISFNKPVSGLLTGPKAAKLYFNDVRGILVPTGKVHRRNDEREQARAVRWYSGNSGDKCFSFDARSASGNFEGTDQCKIIHVNVGISNYGWNISFDNGLFMSFRDLQEYQTRYGQLPASSGVIIHGQQTLKFSNVEKIVVYEAAQYFTYG